MSKKNYVKGDFIFENGLKVDGELITDDLKTLAEGTITRTTGLVTSVAIGSRTITINRDVDDIITGWEDATHEWTLTKSDGVITGWTVATK